eukprot:TRINITY_DN37629_c0_g1_i1.p1 TRINITY_DN37629_c0_g1~~TRINITY_DN37629_c0_g1_i1.p1  ORF type:complete len:451 (-),score=50.21 TRINITY_DN37629_c0_g1_i1:1-1353(-)
MWQWLQIRCTLILKAAAASSALIVAVAGFDLRPLTPGTNISSYCSRTGEDCEWTPTLSKLITQAHSEWKSSVYLVVTNSAFRGAFENLIAMTETYMGSKPIVVSLDDATAKFFEARAVPTVRCRSGLFDPDRTLSRKDDLPGYRVYHEMLRYSLALTLIRRGLQVFYADIDVFLAGNPFSYLPESGDRADLLLSAHGYNTEVCSGMWMAMPTPNCAKLLETVIDWSCHKLNIMERDEDRLPGEHGHRHHVQLAFDFAIRNDPEPFKLHRNVDESDLIPLRGCKLVWEFLPLIRFMHYTTARLRDVPPWHVRFGDGVHLPRQPLLAAHLWGQAGTPDARVVFACLTGLWLSDPPLAAAERLASTLDLSWRLGPGTGPRQWCRWCDHGWNYHSGLAQRRFAWCTGKLSRNITVNGALSAMTLPAPVLRQWVAYMESINSTFKVEDIEGGTAR